MSHSSDRPMAELLESLLGPRAARRLSTVTNLAELRRFTVGELRSTYGLGPRAAVQTRALLELAHRIDSAPLKEGRSLPSSADIAAHGRSLGLARLPVEEFHVLLLDAKNRLIESVLCSRGVLTSSLVHPREVFGLAIRSSAAAVVLLHNHPSGDPEPSPEDREITRRLAAVGELVGIRIVDHVVVARRGYVSFLERGLI